ncbi:hypothetical protein Hypma_000753 [Hypsizygus marmoreus]|uniref:Uncharacterized protein n=1 Tax=Hypsizygus marmoreus TaxID=39966 RepID=A0A369JDN4_HYPMA|nr:hypothetical protein Hypma_000753 [Hypsizygus marmoreus]
MDVEAEKYELMSSIVPDDCSSTFTAWVPKFHNMAHALRCPLEGTSDAYSEPLALAQAPPEELLPTVKPLITPKPRRRRRKINVLKTPSYSRSFPELMGLPEHNYLDDISDAYFEPLTLAQASSEELLPSLKPSIMQMARRRRRKINTELLKGWQTWGSKGGD